MRIWSLETAIVVLSVSLAILPVAGQTKWRFPVIIEALKDVQAKPLETGGQLRGALYVSGGKSLRINKGQRFLMVKVYSEGECRIQFENKQYDVSSCPWMEGFADHHDDVFKLVAPRAGRKLP
jgi:hypothetical protein